MDYDETKSAAHRLADKFQMPVTLSTDTKDGFDGREEIIEPRAVEEALGIEFEEEP